MNINLEAINQRRFIEKNSEYLTPCGKYFTIKGLEYIHSRVKDVEGFLKKQIDKVIDYRERKRLIEQLWAYRRSRARLDIGYFCALCFPHVMQDGDGNMISPPDFHYEIWDAIEEKDYVLAIMPRDSGKTTQGKFLVMHRVLFEHSKAILFQMPTDLGLKVMKDIRDEFENNIMMMRLNFDRRIVPTSKQVERTKVWRQRELNFLNGAEIRLLGKGQSARGFRPDFCWLDDIQSNSDVDSVHKATKQERDFKTEILGAVKNGGKVLFTGTVVGELSLVKKIYDSDDNSFYKLKYEAIKNMKRDDSGKIISGDVLWPDRWDLEKYNQRMRDLRLESMGGDPNALFMQEYMNVPMVLNSVPVFSPHNHYKIVRPTFQFDDIKFYGELNSAGFPIAENGVVIGVDLAEGTAKGDYSTIVGCGRDGRLIFQYRGRIGQVELVSVLDYIITERDFRGYIIPERNIGGSFISHCQDYWWFTEMMYREIAPDRSGKGRFTKSYGYYTSEKSKRTMVEDFNYLLRLTSERMQGNEVSKDNLKGIARDVRLIEISEEIKSEIDVFYRGENGKMGARAGFHDDLIMAIMLAYQGTKKEASYGEMLSRSDIGL